MADRKPIPKTQKQLSQESITPKVSGTKAPSSNKKRRELQRTVINDTTKNFSIGIRDIDEAIFYYFNNVIKLSVIQNNSQKNVPILYGSPERWKAVQKDGFYRDKNGKVLTPLLMLKRDSLEKNRNLGNKMDANNPINYGIFEKKYSKKNAYDKFSILNNRTETKEYQGVVIPDFVNMKYSCIIFTSYIEQMNKLIEAINYASDSYWGDPNKFNFRAQINDYATTTEVAQGQDRTIKTSFTISLLGHIVPDSINATLQGSNKFFSKSRVNFGMETVSDIAVVDRNRIANNNTNQTRSRFYDKAGDSLSITTIEESMTAEQKEYVSLERMYTSNNKTVTVDSAAKTITWENTTISTPPSGFPDLIPANFKVFINGLIVESDAITSIEQIGNGVVVLFNDGLGFDISDTDEYSISGKFTA